MKPSEIFWIVFTILIGNIFKVFIYTLIPLEAVFVIEAIITFLALMIIGLEERERNSKTFLILFFSFLTTTIFILVGTVIISTDIIKKLINKFNKWFDSKFEK